MSDVRLLIQEEGRTARNLVVFNVPVGTNNVERITRKPPSIPRVARIASIKRSMKNSSRVRSASTGRDKKSELQARYWAFLFGNLERAVDGIYQTCEEDENISECKEVILVLENYTRDFHNLIEWFKVKWAYESSPPPLRRTPLAWEVRKTSPCRAWNSSVVPKCTSPGQLSSPTGISGSCPLELPTIENALLNNERNSSALQESAHEKTMDNRANSARTTQRDNNAKETESDRGGRDKTAVQQKPIVKSSAKNQIRETKNFSTLSRYNRPSKGVVSSGTAVESVNNDRENVNSKKEDSGPRIIGKSTRAVSDLETLKNKINDKDSDRRETNNRVLNDKKLNENGTTNSGITKVTTNRIGNCTEKKTSVKSSRPAYSTVSRVCYSTGSLSQETPKILRSKTTLGLRETHSTGKPTRSGTFSNIRRRLDLFPSLNAKKIKSTTETTNETKNSTEIMDKKIPKNSTSEDGWQTVRSRWRRGSTHNLNMAMRFNKPSTATSLPALSIESPCEKIKNTASFTPEFCDRTSEQCITQKAGKNRNNEVEKVQGERQMRRSPKNEAKRKSRNSVPNSLNDTNSTSVIAAVFKNEAELLEKRIQQFMAAQAERERIILEEERKTEEADSQRSQQLSDEEAFLQRQILELESTEIDIDTETDETDGETVIEIDDSESVQQLTDNDDISLEDRYENMLEGMSSSERMDTLAQLQDLVARHPGRALELHQKLSSPSRKRSLAETLRRYQAKQACAQHKRQTLLSKKSQRLRELLNKVEDVKSAKNQLIEDKRVRMELKLKRAEENRTQHLLEIVRKAHDEDSKLKEIAFINELEAQNKRHDFMALCQEQEERLQGIQEERQRRQEEKAAKEAAAEERRRAIEADRQLRIQKMRQARREREERVGKMQLEREKERQELAREKARDREERLSALHAAQLANQEELQKKIAQKQQESARRHGENIEHIRQRAVESSILRSEEVPPSLKSYPAQKQCTLCGTQIPNEVCLLSHLKRKTHLEAVKKMHDGREPSRDELQRFNIAQIRDVSSPQNSNVNGVGTNDETKVAREKQKALKRRSRKLKQRMSARGQEWETQNSTSNQVPIESPNKAKFRQYLKELERLISNHAKTVWPSVAVARLDRCLGELSRTFLKAVPVDQEAFRTLNGLDTLFSLINLGLNVQNTSQNLPNKSLVLVCRVYKAAINGHNANIENTLLSNKIVGILDLLLQRFESVTALDDHSQAMETSTNLSVNSAVTSATIQLLCSLIPEVPFEKQSLQSRLHDIVGSESRVVRRENKIMKKRIFVKRWDYGPP
ncbi:S phase cyclin A-associated protein in the endoplasmic reticulum isoform X2 [Venturia canescens]|uniref:S phase cyclin A-associated protein in the endoplasmic reticulum isoform X2 n=1 Tax=Venturia canescens TaxID=32260 RepID=UPI001C9CF819|nr:S phase cyclin A-associated protein in the endoplasmic reticulum isoform X2 [Venturia canescens]